MKAQEHTSEKHKVTFNLQPNKTDKKEKSEESSSSEGFCTLDINVSKRIQSSIKSEIRKSRLHPSIIAPKEFPKDESFPAFQKRVKAMGEIFESEKIYFRDLVTWGHEFKSKLLESDSLNLKRKTDICNSIFAGFDKIIDLHGRIIESIIDANQLVYKRKGNERFNSINLVDIEDLKYRRDGLNPGIIDLQKLNYSTIYIKYLPQYYNYIDYVKGLPRAEYELESEYATNSKFKKTVDAFLEEYNVKNLGIKHFLYRPSQKLNRYTMLFKAIAKVEKIDLYKKQILYLMNELGKINKSVDITFGLINQQFECFKLSKELKYDDSVKNRFPLNLLLKSQKIIKRGKVLIDISNLTDNQNTHPLSLEIIILTDIIIFCKIIKKGFNRTRLIVRQPLHLLKIVIIDKPLSSNNNVDLKKYHPLYIVEKGSNNFISILFLDPITRNVYNKIISEQITKFEGKLDPNFLLVEYMPMPSININTSNTKYNMIVIEKIQDANRDFEKTIEEFSINTDLGVFDISESESSSKIENEDHIINETCGCSYMKDHEFYTHVLDSNLELTNDSINKHKTTKETSITNGIYKKYVSDMNDCCKERIINTNSQSLIETYTLNDLVILAEESYTYIKPYDDKNVDIKIVEKSYIQLPSSSQPKTNEKEIGLKNLNKVALSTQEKILDIIDLYANKTNPSMKKNGVNEEKILNKSVPNNELTTKKDKNIRENEIISTTSQNEQSVDFKNKVSTTQKEKANTIEKEKANTIEKAKANTIEKEKANKIEKEKANKIEKEKAIIIEKEKANIIEKEKAKSIDKVKIQSQINSKKSIDIPSESTSDSSTNSEYSEEFESDEKEILEKVFKKSKRKDLKVQDMNKKYIKNIKINFRLTKKMVLLATDSGLFKLTKKLQPYDKKEGPEKQIKGRTCIELFNKNTQKIYYNSTISIILFLSEGNLFLAKFNHFCNSIEPQLIVEECENFFFDSLNNSIAVVKRTQGDIISTFLYKLIIKRDNVEINNKDIEKELEKTAFRSYTFYKRIKVYYKKTIELENLTLSVKLEHKLFIGTHIESIYFSKNVLIIGGAQFETINPDNLKARELIDPLDLIIPYYFELLDSVKCKKLFFVDNKYLVVYSKIGFFVDKYGSTIDDHIIFTWVSELEDCFIIRSDVLVTITKNAKKCPYQNLLMVVSKESYEIWNLENGKILTYSIKKDLEFIVHYNIPLLHNNNMLYSLSLNN